MQRFAKDLVALQPDLIVSQSTPTTAEILQQTRTIPIIFALVIDPVGSGFVASLPRPGGNVTGFVAMEGSLAGKWLELLKEIAPRINRVAFLFDSVNAPYAEYFLPPSKPPLRPLPWTRSRHLFATRQSLNPLLPQKHASRMVA
jgi:putative tryptophan/tyrosine transport system substrate-binding protein